RSRAADRPFNRLSLATPPSSTSRCRLSHSISRTARCVVSPSRAASALRSFLSCRPSRKPACRTMKWRSGSAFWPRPERRRPGSMRCIGGPQKSVRWPTCPAALNRSDSSRLAARPSSSPHTSRRNPPSGPEWFARQISRASDFDGQLALPGFRKASRAERPQGGRSGFQRQRGENVLQTTTVTPNRILDVSYAFWKTKSLLSAVALNVFTLLAEGLLDLPTLVARFGLDGRGARDFFDALAALGFLDRDAQGKYVNGRDVDFYLDRGKPSYIGGLLEHLNTRHYQNWSLLTQALRSGAPPSGALATGSYPALYADSMTQEVFLNGMTAGSLVAAQALASKFPWHRYETFIDIGTAQGCVPVQIARVHSHLTGGGFDLPQIEPAFRNYVREHGLEKRLQFYAGDFFAEALPGADVLIMGRILHNWDVPTRELLLRKAYQALRAGGALIVYDPMVGQDRCTDAHALLSSLNMLIETTGGSEYSGGECMNWMRQAGF